MRRLPHNLLAAPALLVLIVTSGAVQEQRRAPDYPDHTRLLVVRDEGGREQPVRNRIDWQVRRAHILSHLQDVMGPLPGGERRVPLNVEIVEEHEEPRYMRRKITFATEPGDRCFAWLLLPKAARKPVPGVLCLHQTIAAGKDEPAGLAGDPDLHYARELAERGFACIAPDYPNFGEYRVDVYKFGYASASMKGIWNHLRAVDVLASQPEVDGARLGVIGHSLGGHNALFVALFDPRLQAVVSSCGFNAFPHYYGGNIAGWSHAGYMPRLRDVYSLDLARVPFDFPELLAALAPRDVFICAPLHDENFAVGGVRCCVDAAKSVFELHRAARRLHVEYPDAGHTFPDATRLRAYVVLEKALCETDS